jgi:hypothetical protein
MDRITVILNYIASAVGASSPLELGVFGITLGLAGLCLTAGFWVRGGTVEPQTDDLSWCSSCRSELAFCHCEGGFKDGGSRQSKHDPESS